MTSIVLNALVISSVIAELISPHTAVFTVWSLSIHLVKYLTETKFILFNSGCSSVKSLYTSSIIVSGIISVNPAIACCGLADLPASINLL